MAAMEAPAKVATSPTVLLPATVYKRSTEHLHDKRSRSSTPLPEPLKKPDDQDDTSLPAFLRQSDAGMFPMGCIREPAVDLCIDNASNRS